MKIADFAAARKALVPYMARASVPGAYTLERQVRLMEYLDNPQDKVKVVHVAGTSGKTSTSYYAAALLQAAGFKVGLTVSPHVDEINERVQINLVPLPEREFCTDLGTFMDIVEQSGAQPTYFELLVAFAYWQFARRGMEYAVVEVGLGGLLDSTNVVTRADKICIITDLGMDHMNVLGNTLSEIAAQKAGIIQLHNTVFCYGQDNEAMTPIRARAAQKQADLHVLSQAPTPTDLQFLPLFQQRNFQLSQAAVAVALARDNRAPLTQKAISQAAHTTIPARMETFQVHGKTIIIDGSHNAQKMHALVASIIQRYPGEDAAALLSFAAHGAYRLETATAELAPVVRHAVVTSFHGAQDFPSHSVPPEALRDACIQAGITAVDILPDPAKAWQALLARPEPILLIAGSFYLLNHIRPFVLSAPEV